VRKLTLKQWLSAMAHLCNDAGRDLFALMNTCVQCVADGNSTFKFDCIERVPLEPAAVPCLAALAPLARQ
jgi:hypothetical protein